MNGPAGNSREIPRNMKLFKVLKFNQALMAWLGIHSYHLTEKSNEFAKSFGTYYILLTIFAIFIVSSGYTAIFSSKFQIVIQATLLVVAGAQSGGMFLSIGLQMKKIKILQLKLQEIIDDCTVVKVYDIYWKNEQKCRKYTKIIAYYVFFNQTAYLLVLIIPIYSIATGNINPSTWMLMYNLILPFDRTQVFGWFLHYFAQFNVGLTYSLILVSITSYFVCCCFYIDSTCEHFDLLINSIRNYIESNDIESIDIESNNIEDGNEKVPTNWRRVKQELRDAINFHVNIYEIFDLLVDINSGVIFWLLPLDGLFMSISLWNLERSASNLADWGTVGYGIICIICASAWPFLFCYFATLATERIVAISQTTFDSNWYIYPPEFQKYIILIIAQSQKPVYFTGLGIVHCSLETLAKVFNTSCSFYIVFRRISHH